MAESAEPWPVSKYMTLSPMLPSAQTRAAVQRLAGLVCLVEQRQVHAEAAVGGLGSGDGLKDQIDGRAVLERRQSAW